MNVQSSEARNKTLRTTVCALGCLLAFKALGDMHFVSPSGLGLPPYTNWNDAATSIQPAIDTCTAGDVVLVTNGTYRLSAQIIIAKGITLRSVNGGDLTTISGLRAVRCLYVEHPDAVVQGFTLKRGDATYGGGAFLEAGGRLVECAVLDNSSGVYCNGGGTVSNCAVLLNSGTAVSLNHGGRVEDSCIYSNTASAVSMTGTGWVERCLLFKNIDGVRTEGKCSGTIRNSRIASNSQYGLILSGCTVSQCTVVSNQSYGVYCSDGTVIEDSHVADNGWNGVYAMGDCRLYRCMVTGNERLSSYSGGGVYLSPGVHEIRDSTISSNRWGGIFQTQGSCLVADCTISGNGRGISQSGVLRVDRCTINANQCLGNGGALRCSGQVTIFDSTIASNTATGSGGAIENTSTTPVEINRCRIVGNSAVDGQGGGVYGVAQIADSWLVGNSAGAQGGGASLTAAGSSRVSRTFVTGNTATGDGGGLSFASAGVVENCIIANNSTLDDGGGIEGATVTIRQCTIVSNSAVDLAGGVYKANGVDNSIIYYNHARTNVNWNTVSWFRNCCILPNAGTPSISNTTNPPAFASPSLGTYELSESSPCIDAGTTLSTVITDIAGIARPLDGDGDGSPRHDIGAYEFIRDGEDSDKDGLPDGWESANGLNPTLTNGVNGAAGDLDGDGADNHAEYVADTCPTNALSVLRITSLTQSARRLRIDWTGGRLAKQVVEYVPTLATTNVLWSPLKIVNPPTPSSMTALFSGLGTGAIFRIRASR